MADAIPLLWLCGPPGVGKTSAGFAIYAALVSSGVHVAFVDIDQLGICYPDPPSDPDRHRMKAHNLAAVIATFRATGARGIVVSGVVDHAHPPAVDGAEVTLCRLRADPDELVRRFLGRTQGDVQEVLAEAAALDARAVGDLCVDATVMTEADVVAGIRARTDGWWDEAGPVGPGPDPTDLDGDEGVVWLCGPTGVGTSAVGFAVYLRLLHAASAGPGRRAGYVDLDQLGFCGAHDGGDRIRGANLAAVWRTFRVAGARTLVVVGPVVGRPPSALFRLHASPAELTRRILLRGAGKSWPQPGDPLRGRDPEHLRAVANGAAAHAEALERAGTGRRIDTDGREIEEIAAEILGLL